MILSGFRNNKNVVASISHYDYREFEDIMADGGQPYTFDYAGYSRFRGTPCIFKVPQNYAELYHDYQFNRKDREYGVWKLKDVEILPDDIELDIEELKFQNAIWGTRGKSGKEPLKYVHLVDCETDHLEEILKLKQVKSVYTIFINRILKERKQ
jgi:hypothetical protein